MLSALKIFYRKYTIQIGLVGFIVGLIFLILSSLGLFIGELDFVKNNDFLQGFYDAIGNYIYWLFIGMLTLTIAGGWIAFDLVFKLKRFNRLITTTSKATFVRNQNEIEDLAWHLGPNYMDIVQDRKRKFRIRK